MTENNAGGNAVSLERDTVVLLHGVEHDDALQPGYIGNLTELLDEEAAVGGHVRYDDLDHKIMLAADHVEFYHFREGGDPTDEFAALAGGMFFQDDVHEKDDEGTDLVGIDHSGIVVDDPGGFQSPEAFVNGCGGKVYFFGQFADGEPAIFLQKVEDAKIDGIEGKRRGGQMLFFTSHKVSIAPKLNSL